MVISSVMEGGANVICEAGRIGVPVLASRVSGNIGMLGSDYPGYFRLFDDRGLARLIKRAMDDATFYRKLKHSVLERKALFAPAAELFERFVKDFSKSNLLASALFYAGEANFRAGRVDRTAKWLTTLVDEHSSGDFAAPAMLRLGECHATLQKWALSEETFQRFLERFPDGEQWYQAQFGVGWSRENQKRYDEAVAAYEKVTARHQGPTAARAQFQIGQCHFAQKKFEPAIRELLKVDILYAYPEWSAAALYEAGRCFSQLNDPVQARQQFNTVVEKYKDTKWAEMAQEQLTELTSSAALPGK